MGEMWFPEEGDGCFVTRWAHEVGMGDGGWGMGEGSQKLAQLRKNCNWFRGELRELGFEVLGDDDSPVMPIMLYNPAKIAAFSRECLKRNVSEEVFLLSHHCLHHNHRMYVELSRAPYRSSVVDHRVLKKKKKKKIGK